MTKRRIQNIIFLICYIIGIVVAIYYHALWIAALGTTVVLLVMVVDHWRKHHSQNKSI